MNGDNVSGGPDWMGKMVSRRALVRAGWVVPVVLAVGIPRNALAATGSDAGPPIEDCNLPGACEI